MNVGIITSPFGPLPPNALGAIERRWYYMAEAMSRKGISVEFYSKADSGYNPPQGISIKQIAGYKRTRHIYFDIAKDFYFTLKALIKLKKCDILIQNTFWAPILSPLFRGRFRKSVYNVARMPKSQFKAYGAVHQFSCVSASVKNELEAIIGENERIVVVSNPVNTGYFSYKERKNDTEAMTIAYHGRIHKEKGLDILCKACQMLVPEHNIRLRLIGPHEIERGGSGEDYVEMLRGLCPDVEITFTGAVSNPRQLNEMLEECDIYCYPSVADKGETFGVSPLEAMCTGAPVIVSSLACFRDFITDGETGLVFDHHAPDAVEQLKDRIERLIDDRELRSELGRRAYARAQDFSVGKIADRYISNFEELLKR